MKCSNCGNEINPNAKFCNYCGTKVIWQEPVPSPPDSQDSGSVGQTENTDKKIVWNDKYSIIAIIAAMCIAALIGFAVKTSKSDKQDSEETSHAAKVVENSEGFRNTDETEDGNMPDESESEHDKEEMENPEFVEYDTNVWDYRFPELPSYVSQQYFVIFNEGEREGRIELSVFDINGNLDGNYLVWNGSGNAIELNDQSVMKNCDQFYFDGSSWVEFYRGYHRMGDSAEHIIISNLDVYDSGGDMVQAHITGTDILEPLELPGSNRERGDYILEGSDYRYINESELQGFTAEDCRLARNEIYARHGRKFQDEKLQAYFESFEWYHPSVEASAFRESVLNAYETANRDLIVKYEEKHGYR